MSPTLRIAIAGSSGSGKTWLAEEIRVRLNPVPVSLLSLDNYYVDLSSIPLVERALRNFDEPAAIDFHLLRQHWRNLVSGRAVDAPIYDFSQHTRSDVFQRIDPAPVIILEGLFALHDPEIRRMSDILVFVEAPSNLCLARRMDRDIRERGRTEESVRKQFNEQVQPMYIRHVLPTREYAHFIISGASGDTSRESLFHELRSRIRL